MQISPEIGQNVVKYMLSVGNTTNFIFFAEVLQQGEDKFRAKYNKTRQNCTLLDKTHGFSEVREEGEGRFQSKSDKV